jgi:transposase InsO family protein
VSKKRVRGPYQRFDGRPFRILTVVDLLSRESPLIEVDLVMSGQRVADALEARTAEMPAPVSITVDHGSEFTAKVLDDARPRSKRGAWITISDDPPQLTGSPDTRRLRTGQANALRDFLPRS